MALAGILIVIVIIIEQFHRCEGYRRHRHRHHQSDRSGFDLSESTNFFDKGKFYWGGV
jgi:hypothetical protein